MANMSKAATTSLFWIYVLLISFLIMYHLLMITLYLDGRDELTASVVTFLTIAILLKLILVIFNFWKTNTTIFWTHLIADVLLLVMPMVIFGGMLNQAPQHGNFPSFGSFIFFLGIPTTLIIYWTKRLKGLST